MKTSFITYGVTERPAQLAQARSLSDPFLSAYRSLDSIEYNDCSVNGQLSTTAIFLNIAHHENMPI